jgi:hypothetical protein
MLAVSGINDYTEFYTASSCECGPRALLALTMMALHPNADSIILFPLMHPNLAQISRTWVAKTIITKHLDIYPFPNSQTNPPIPFRGQSCPTSVIDWHPNSHISLPMTHNKVKKLVKQTQLCKIKGKDEPPLTNLKHDDTNNKHMGT